MTRHQNFQLAAVDPFRVMTTGETADLIGISIRTLPRMVERGDFPSPLQLGGRRIGWRRGTVENWILARERDAAAVSS